MQGNTRRFWWREGGGDEFLINYSLGAGKRAAELSAAKKPIEPGASINRI